MTNTVTQYLVNALANDKLILLEAGKVIAKGGYAVLSEGEHLEEAIVNAVKSGVARLTTTKPSVVATVAAVIDNPLKGMSEEELKADLAKTKVAKEVVAEVAKVETAVEAEPAKVEGEVVTAVEAGAEDAIDAVTKAQKKAAK